MARTKGSSSHVRTTLRELNRVLKENAEVVCGRQFIDALNLQCQPFKSNKQAVAEIVKAGIDAPEEKPPPIAINIQDFNE